MLLGGAGGGRLGRSGGTRGGSVAGCGLAARVHRLRQGLRPSGSLSRRDYRRLFGCRTPGRCHCLCTASAFLEHSGPAARLE